MKKLRMGAKGHYLAKSIITQRSKRLSKSLDNLLEQEVRVNTLVRKNWLFAGSRHGGKRIAIMYSLLACCSEYNIDPNIYLEDVISRIDPDNTKINDIKELLPHRWKPLYLILLPSVKLKTDQWL